MLLIILLFLGFAFFVLILSEGVVFEWVRLKTQSNTVQFLMAILIILTIFAALYFDSYTFLNYRR